MDYYLNGFTLTIILVTSGIAQGFDIGSLLFHIYINDLPNCLSSNYILYAHDL